MSLNYFYQQSILNTATSSNGTLMMFGIAALLVITFLVADRSPFRRWLLPLSIGISIAVYISALLIPALEGILL